MTWTLATETNLDFELSTIGTYPNGDDTNNPGWNSTRGSYRITTDTADGGTKGWRGDNDYVSQTYRNLTIPANTKKVRLTAWLGRTTADGDQCVAILYLYNASAELIGGLSLGSTDTGDNETLEYIAECIVPAATDTVRLELNAVRVDGSANNGVCASTKVEWFIDAALTVYETPSFLVNGGFEVGDSDPPTGWEHVSGNGLDSVTDAKFVFSGTYGGRAVSGDTEISQQTVFNVPAAAEDVYFYGVTLPDIDASGNADRMRLRLIFEDVGGTEIGNTVLWGMCGDISPVPMTVTEPAIPVGTTTIKARAEFYLGFGTAVNVALDAAVLIDRKSVV